MNKLLATAALAAITLAVPQLAAAQDSPWQVRGRILMVEPDDSATIQAIGGTTDISTSYVPELDITYFFTDTISAELILGVTPHDVAAINTAVGRIDLGDVTLLPPTLTVQYHFNTENAFRPYVGAGVNYTVFFDADPGPVANKVSYDNAFGFALQAGVDYYLDDNWFLNLDVKRLWLNTDVTVNATTALGAVVGADVDINPWIVGVGFGYRF